MKRTCSFINHILRSCIHPDHLCKDYERLNVSRYDDFIGRNRPINGEQSSSNHPSSDSLFTSANRRSSNTPSSNSNPRPVRSGGGGGGGDDSDDSDSSDDEDSDDPPNRGNGNDDTDNNDDDEDDNDGDDNRAGPSQPSQGRNPRHHAVYRSGRYKGMLRCRAAMHYRPDTFVFVTDVGNLTVECNHCHALKFVGEKPGMCCNNGKVNVPIPTLPSELAPLLNGTSSLSVPYLKNIQQYNNLLNFTSFAANQQFITDRNGQRQWTPGFKVLGQIYHRIGPLFPNPGEPAAHLQMYFLSEDEQFRRRSSIFEGLSPEVIRHNSALMNSHDPYVNEFQSAISTIRHSNIPNLKVNFCFVSIFFLNFTNILNSYDQQPYRCMFRYNISCLFSGNYKIR